MQTAHLIPLALKDAPALMESVFPVQKVSFEAQSERKAVAGQTLTGLGSYWKGRKPLILVRALVLGCLLPPTDDAQADLAIFERLLAFDEESLARRALAANGFAKDELCERLHLSKVEQNYYFGKRGWNKAITEDEKLVLYRRALATLESYEKKAKRGKRPEEVDDKTLYADLWPAVNRHYAHLGVNAQTLPELTEQLGILRYGKRPRVGDTFSGGGSIPFEAARIGCDVYAADLNPIACLLTWGALNIIGAAREQQATLQAAQAQVFAAVEADIKALGIEHDAQGNRAKAYLYCLEVTCPQSGWRVPLAPSWVISPKQGVIARLLPDASHKRFDIEIASGVADAEMAAAQQGTVQNGELVYVLNGKTLRTPIKTLRGDFKAADASTGNRLRRWELGDIAPRQGDIFQERLYAIQWITAATLAQSRQETFFAAPTDEDIQREQQVHDLVAANLEDWQQRGLVPDMPIEAGDKTDELIRTRGWTHWHHLFNPRQLLLLATASKAIRASTQPALGWIVLAKMLNFNARLCQWLLAQACPNHVFYNQAFNTFYNYGTRASLWLGGNAVKAASAPVAGKSVCVHLGAAEKTETACDLWLTDPPYADAVHYHEITEFFIAWLRKHPPAPFDTWVWDSRRALAIKGAGEDFRRNMVNAYRAMTAHMPESGRQCVLFTHQDTAVWSDLVGIFWAAGLQVTAAWYIATETTSELKKGGYVQGTVLLLLQKRAPGERTGYRQRLLPLVREEVARQIDRMLHLSDTQKAAHGEVLFNDADLQMAGYAAALKVLTAFTHIGGEDMTAFALRPRTRGEVTVVDEMVQEAAQTAANLLVPQGLASDTWGKLEGIERFMLRLWDMESAGATKLDNYQNFAKAFHVKDYSAVMGDSRPNQARLKHIGEYASGDWAELAPTLLGHLLLALQQRVAKNSEALDLVKQLASELHQGFASAQPLLLDLLAFIERKAPEAVLRTAAEVLRARLANWRFGE